MWWGTPLHVAEARASAEQAQRELPTLGATPVDVEVAPKKEGARGLADGIRGLYDRRDLCDLVLVAAGERFPAHRAMIAAMSASFREYLLHAPVASADAAAAAEDPMQGALRRVPPTPAPAPSGSTEASAASAASAEAPAPESSVAVAGGDAAGQLAASDRPEVSALATPAAPAAAQGGAEESEMEGAPATAPGALLELEVACSSSAEAVGLLLSYVYVAGTGGEWHFEPSCAQVNKDVLHLARAFALPHLHESAARWLVMGLNTGNVVERLVTCEECGLGLLRERILERLAANPAELAVVSGSPAIMKHPRILQDLLLLVATLCERPVPKRKLEATASTTSNVEKLAEQASGKTAEKEKPAKRAKRGGGGGA